MATQSASLSAPHTAEAAERRFFLVMASLIAVIIVSGFSLHLATGRSTFAVPLIYHLHALVFFAWITLFVTQTALVTGSGTALHRRLGLIAFGWVPVMLVVGIALLFTVMRRTGGPFFFDQNQFLFSNPAHLLAFAGLTLAAMKVRRHNGWHRRLMMCGFAVLSGPGLGRLLPMPLAIPHAWHVLFLIVLIFPVAGMIRDRVRNGRVHPAWYWGVGVFLVAQLIADALAMSSFGIGLTEQLVAGTPGGERPMAAFLPPGFAL